jgi:methylenetetrahydrofolate dehydrogenase (NADP+)/methenyltetrahydrofolate cyclohydrolase
MAKIIDGKKLSEKILKNIAGKIKKERLKLKLAVVLVGNNPVSKVFVREKEKACQKTGIGFCLFQFSSAIKPAELEEEIKRVVARTDIKGVIIQLPLPKNFDCQKFLNLIPLEKDVDVLSERALGKFYSGNLLICPPAVVGVRKLFKKYKIKLKGKNIVIVGAGRLIGKPLTLYLLGQEATVTIVNKFTKSISFFTKKADIVISGAGKPNIIKGGMIKKGAVVVDAGDSHRKGRLAGDIDFKSVAKKASYIAPVPGGIGPMTVACLLENLVILNS